MNPVAGPFFNISTNQPTGVVGAFAPQDSALVGFVNTIAPAIVSGNTIVVVTSEKLSLPALSFGKVLAASDLPGDVVNILAGKESELSSRLVGHMDVNAVDLEGASIVEELEKMAADPVKRSVRKATYQRLNSKSALQHILDYMEVKTSWNRKGH